MNYKIIKNNYYHATLEVNELERLLMEAKFRLREEAKKTNKQSWYDYIMEWIGY